VRKRAESEASSFYLLLDMMCNAFGGIIFIGLLIAIISNSMSRQENHSEAAGVQNLGEVEKNIEVSRLNREKQDLQATAARIKETLGQADNSSLSVAETTALISSNAQLQLEIIALASSNASLSSAVADCMKSAEASTISKADIKEQLKRLSEELRQKREELTRTVRLPRLHAVEGKQSVFFAIKDGKCYALTDVSTKHSPWLHRDYDKDEAVVESGPGLDVIELRDKAGQVVKPGCEGEGKIAQAIANLDKECEFPSFSVYTNSFGEFNYMKTLFVKRGFEYNWIIAEGAIQIIIQKEPLKVQ